MESALAAVPSLCHLVTWMREMLAENRADAMIASVVQRLDGILERHLEQLRDAIACTGEGGLSARLRSTIHAATFSD